MTGTRAKRPTVVLISGIVTLVAIGLVAILTIVGGGGGLAGLISNIGGLALVVFIISGIVTLIRRGKG
jgi:hypothetical protein